MEFEIKTDLSVLPAVIESNAEEVKAQLSQALEKYKTLAITPETMKQAKSDKADLNKLRTAIEECRKGIKRQCLAPYEAFEAKCKEITAMIDEPIGMIDTQLKSIAESVLVKKRDALQEYFANIIASMEEDVSWIELGRILNPKWKNATMKLETLKQEILNTMFRMSEEQQEIEKIYGNTPLYPAIWNKYLETYDKGQALAYAAILIQQEQQRQTEQPTLAPPKPQPPKPAQGDKVGICAFRVTGTAAQIVALRDFMKQNGIRFEILK